MGKRSKNQRNILRAKDDSVIENLVQQCNELTSAPESGKFGDLPISEPTKKGLEKAGFVTMTDIQKRSIHLALQGKDILGAAKTGSGKTLSFLIPMLEMLFKRKWSSLFGVGALVITPTRELAYQIFEVLRKIGAKHEFSAGLVIGGKDVGSEQAFIGRMNILICTPGRLLHHLDQTPDFECGDVQILVLDEADRCLDMGFQKTMDAIIDCLPKTRQTLLYSATQTKSINALARLSLKDPEYVSVHENATHSTPSKLAQTYVECELKDKLSILFSFLRSHTKDKVLVFVSSCKQVRFIYEAFKRMRVGLPMLELHGQQKQMKRMAIYNDFCKQRSACLVATDIAARGLDIPEVSWVVQVDIPEDASTYIHRVGRTARFESKGNGMMMVLAGEKAGLLKRLEQRNIPISQVEINPTKIKSIANELSSINAANGDIKHLAQKYVVSYCRSVFLQKDKEVFDVHKLPIKEFALSVGLTQSPKIRFMKKQVKAVNKAKEELETQVDDQGIHDEAIVIGGGDDEKDGARGGDLNGFHSLQGDEEGQDDDFLLAKTTGSSVIDNLAPLTEEEKKQLSGNNLSFTKKLNKSKDGILSRTQVAKAALKAKGAIDDKIMFEDSSESDVSGAEEEAGDGINVERRKKLMKKIDRKDKEEYRQKVKTMHKDRKLKEKSRGGKRDTDEGSDGDGLGVQLGDGEGSEVELYLGERSDDSESDEPASKKPRTLKDDEALALELLGN